MARSSIDGVERADPIPAGRDIDALGPSDSSDSGSDMQGIAGREGSDTDAAGTGERSSATPERVVSDRDILPDRITGNPDAQPDEEDLPALGEVDNAALGDESPG